MIAIIDYGAGNIQSVSKALKHIGCDCFITNNKEEILSADGAVLPGVGSFGAPLDTMERLGLTEAGKEFRASGRPWWYKSGSSPGLRRRPSPRISTRCR